MCFRRALLKYEEMSVAVLFRVNNIFKNLFRKHLLRAYADAFKECVLKS